jgi:hypothetical protein
MARIAIQEQLDGKAVDWMDFLGVILFANRL